MYTGQVARHARGGRHRRRPFRRRRRRLPALLVAGAAIAAALGGAAWLAVPVMATALSETRETAAAVVTLEADDVRASVRAPARWSVTRPFLQPDRVELQSPDGRLVVHVVAVPVPLETAFATLPETAAAGGTVRRERLGSGFDAVHVDDDAALVAAVGRADGASSVTVVARVDGADIGVYRVEVGRLLEGLEVAS